MKQEYFCEKCGLDSFVEQDEKSSVFQFINMLEDDHKKKSPECPVPVEQLKIRTP